MSKAQWYGNVTNVEGDIFTAILRRDGQPDLLADFDMKRCGLADIEPGDCIIVTPDPVLRMERPVWSKEQLDAIWVHARERSRRLGFTLE